MSELKQYNAETFVEEALRLIPKTPSERLTQHVKDLLKSKEYVHDVHVHTFDKHSINESYFIKVYRGMGTRRTR